MIKVHARRHVLAAALVAALGLLFWTGCSKELMSPDEQAPTGSQITNPVDGSSLNRDTINVRGRAEVGATVQILVNDEPRGTAVSSPAVPSDGLGGRFTVEGVELGEEGQKHIVARVTDLYGNVATDAHTPSVMIDLDQTAPPVEFEDMTNAEWKDTTGVWGNGYWQSGQPEIVAQGKTDVTAAGARMRDGIDDHIAGPFEEVPGEPDARRFYVDIPLPRLTGGNTDTLIIYRMEAYDEAGNIGVDLVPVLWEIQAREEELKNDDGVVDSFDHAVTGQPGQKLAVRFQAPTWANYVTKVLYYIGNDNVTNPIDPDRPSTWPFTVYVWQVTLPDSMPGSPGNDGHTPWTEPYAYPEDQWIEVELPNPVPITDNDSYPDKKFFVGLEWEYRLNPYIYEDHASPTNTLNYSSFRWDWFNWDLRDEADSMIRAVVSDVPNIESARRAALMPTRSASRR
jgi:hypothetical protein